MKTANELQHLSERYAWKTGPLTHAQVLRMTSDEYQYQSLFNKAELERALREPQVKKQTGVAALTEKANRHKTRMATPEDLKAAEADCLKFASDYPQLIQDAEQNQAIVRWILDQNLPVDYKNLVRAFEALTQNGELLVNPSAIGAGSETEVTGHRLRTHPNLWRLLEPFTTKNPVATMSAAEYKKANPEVFGEAGIPPMIAKRFDQANVTFLANHPEYLRTDENSEAVMGYIKKWGVMPTIQNLEYAYEAAYKAGELETNREAVVSGAVTRLIDFGGRQQGVPPRSTKPSFQKKIDSLSADEFQREIVNDPAIRAAVNSLG